MLNVNELTGFGVGGGGTTDWRVLIDSGGGSAYYQHIKELQFRAEAGGASMSVGGAAYASSTASGSSPSNAFDGDEGTKWNSNSTVAGEWLAYSHPRGVDVKEVYLTHQPYGVGGSVINSVSVQYQDSAGIWVTAATYSVSGASPVLIPVP